MKSDSRYKISESTGFNPATAAVYRKFAAVDDTKPTWYSDIWQAVCVCFLLFFTNPIGWVLLILIAIGIYTQQA